jgi:hypothetical protein
MSYIPLRGDFKNEKDAIIIQLYAAPYDYIGYNNYQNGNYYISMVSIYSPMYTRLYDACDNYPFRCKLMAEYNALRIGLINAIKMGATNIVFNTDSQKLINQLIEEFIDDSESENSQLSILSQDVNNLHKEVCELFEECDIIAYRFLERSVMIAFEKFVNDNIALANSMKNVSVSSPQYYEINGNMEID